MNPFDRLTDELIVKIFQHYLNHGPTPPAASIEIANLLSICKRFDNIIYNKLPSVFNHQRLQVTFITGLAYDKTRCDYDSAQCACAGLRELASTRIGKSRKLVLSSMDLRQGGCNLEALLRVSLSPIIELILMGRCDFDLFSLDRILTAQPTIKRLILTCDDGKISKESKEQLEKHSKELTCHTLAYLYLDLNSDLFEGEEEQEEGLGDVLLEYMLNYLQAYEIEVRFNNSDPAHYDWVESYLTKHRNTIKHFQFHVHDIDTEMSRIFKNIPHYVQGPVDYHLRYIITSPGHPRSSET